VTPIIIVPPTVEPVDLDEAKLWTKVDGDTEDNDITDLISAAREYCEWRKGYAFYEQTLRVSLSNWPCSTKRIELPRATPLQSIVSVTYTDSTGSHTVDGDSYSVDVVSTPGVVVFGEDYSWPDVDLYAPNPVTIDYVVGLSSDSPIVPYSIKVAMRLLISHWYSHRDAVVIGINNAASQSVPLELGVDALLGVNQQIYAF